MQAAVEHELADTRIDGSLSNPDLYNAIEKG